MKMPAGRYYIGDPCYVLGKPYDQWDSYLDACDYGAYPDFEFNGKPHWVHGTAFGDGCFVDEDGNEYGVDAGLIGAVPIGDDIKEINGGNIFEFNQDFECDYDDGIFTFSNADILIQIDTN